MSRPVGRLQLRDFRLILAIYETGQLALAAERLGKTQPAASRMLAGVERLVGAPVFARHPKGMVATPVGEALARNARELLTGVDQTLDEIEAIIGGLAGTARVGAVTGGAVGFVVPAIQQLKRSSALADIYVHVAPSDALIEGLLKGEYDFVVSRIPPGIDARQFTVRPGRVEVLRFLAREGHPLSGKKQIKLSDLAGCEWVIQPPHTPLRQAIEDVFVSAGIPLPQGIINTTSLLVMLAYVASTDALAPVSREVADLISPDVAGRGLVALTPTEPIVVKPYHLVSLKNQLISPLAARLRDLVFSALSNDLLPPKPAKRPRSGA